MLLMVVMDRAIFLDETTKLSSLRRYKVFMKNTVSSKDIKEHIIQADVYDAYKAI